MSKILPQWISNNGFNSLTIIVNETDVKSLKYIDEVMNSTLNARNSPFIQLVDKLRPNNKEWLRLINQKVSTKSDEIDLKPILADKFPNTNFMTSSFHLFITQWKNVGKSVKQETEYQLKEYLKQISGTKIKTSLLLIKFTSERRRMPIEKCNRMSKNIIKKLSELIGKLNFNSMFYVKNELDGCPEEFQKLKRIITLTDQRNVKMSIKDVKYANHGGEYRFKVLDDYDLEGMTLRTTDRPWAPLTIIDCRDINGEKRTQLVPGDTSCIPSGYAYDTIDEAKMRFNFTLDFEVATGWGLESYSNPNVTGVVYDVMTGYSHIASPVWAQISKRIGVVELVPVTPSEGFELFKMINVSRSWTTIIDLYLPEVWAFIILLVLTCILESIIQRNLTKQRFRVNKFLRTGLFTLSVGVCLQILIAYYGSLFTMFRSSKSINTMNSLEDVLANIPPWRLISEKGFRSIFINQLDEHCAKFPEICEEAKKSDSEYSFNDINDVLNELMKDETVAMTIKDRLVPAFIEGGYHRNVKMETIGHQQALAQATSLLTTLNSPIAALFSSFLRERYENGNIFAVDEIFQTLVEEATSQEENNIQELQPFTLFETQLLFYIVFLSSFLFIIWGLTHEILTLYFTTDQ